MDSPKVTLEKPLAKPPLPVLLLRHAELQFRKATSGLRALPDFIIAGAQKCGTSSLHNYLVQHPRLLAASIKEVHFFDGGLDPGWDKYADGESLYRSYFPLRSTVKKKNALCFEASPDYLFNPLAAERMATLVPDARIIVLLRDPVERAISHYFHELRRGRESQPIEQAFALEDERIGSAIKNGNYKDTRFINLSYKTRGRYAEQLQRLFNYFPRENVKIFEAESFYENPMNVICSVLDFVDMDVSHSKIDVKPIGKGGNKTNVPVGVRESLHEYFSEHNRSLAEMVQGGFRWL